MPMKLLILVHLMNILHGWWWTISLLERLVASNIYIFSFQFFQFLHFNSSMHFILQDLENFASYICKAYKGNAAPKGCKSLLPSTKYQLNKVHSRWWNLIFCLWLILYIYPVWKVTEILRTSHAKIFSINHTLVFFCINSLLKHLSPYDQK